MVRKLGYSQGVKVDNMLFISGQVALGSNGQVGGKGDFARQARCAFENLETMLKPKGASLSDVVKLGVYLTDMKTLSEFRRIRGEYFKDWFPASTLVRVTSLISSELMGEIDAIAVVSK
jgi:2-iminobutanoate/2-iminopropanoate deaminase